MTTKPKMNLSSKSKLYVIIALTLPVIGMIMPFYIKSLLVKRVFQVVFLGIMTLSFVEVLREKYKSKESINYLGLAVVMIFGISLYLIIKRYG